MAQEILNRNKIINSRWKFGGLFVITLFICLWGVEYFKQKPEAISTERLEYFSQISPLLEGINRLSDTIKRFQEAVNSEEPNPAKVADISAVAKARYEELKVDLEKTNKQNPFYNNVLNLLSLANEYRSNIDVMSKKMIDCLKANEKLTGEIDFMIKEYKLDKKQVDFDKKELESKLNEAQTQSASDNSKKKKK